MSDYETVWKKLKENAKRQAKTDAQLATLSKTIGNYINNDAQTVEQFFYNSLKEKLEVNGIKYDSIQENIKIPKKKAEYDIVLTNGDKILIIEVKKKNSHQRYR